MQKSSFLFRILLAGVSIIGLYQSLFELPTATTFDRFFALAGFFLLCISLIIGPLVVIWPKEFAQLVEPRRAVGIAAFIFAVLHIFLVLSFMLDWQLPLLFATLPSLVAVAATIILLALTLTSCDMAIKMMGPVVWKRVQQFNYLAFALVFVHFFQKATGLFVPVGSMVFINAAEAGLVLLGFGTIGIQIAGFITRKNREKAAKAEAGKNQTE